ncbi:MAG: putative SprT family Zn-dependent metalloprotease [Myxococcota bacterium]|jgi:predicted SprT family Zn-dependent metalloprotease
MGEGTQDISVEQLKLKYSCEVLLAMAAECITFWQADGELPQLKIVWNTRLRTSAGRALLREQVVELNPRLLSKNEQDIRAVLVHELAHLLAVARYGQVKAHGREWQQLMIEAGADPKVCHSMDASAFYHRRKRSALSGNRFLRRFLERLIK